MPPSAEQLGPLAGLVGTWEGDEGVDVAYSHERGEVYGTEYRERITFAPFGPVDNGPQCLFGLDYRTAAWRRTDPEGSDPFHTEVGYWLWDATDSQVMRCFMVPRGSTILAGGTTTADARRFTMAAEVGSETYGILSNLYLTREARTTKYVVTVSFGDDDTLSYEETTTIEHNYCDDILAHTDTNRLRRVSS